MSDQSEILKKDDGTNINAAKSNRRIGSMSDDEIIEQNLKELLEKKSREERKANGRSIALIVAFFVIFLAIYNAWIRKSVAGVLVPLFIMLTYGIWVVILAKRDKQRRAIFEKHIEEVMLKNKLELQEKAKIKHGKHNEKNKMQKETTLHIQNEITPIKQDQSSIMKGNASKADGHRKHRKNRHIRLETDSDSCSSGTGSGNSNNKNKINSSQLLTKELGTKRSSIRQKIFRKHAVTNVEVNVPERTHFAQSKKRLQRLATFSSKPKLVRMGSAP